MSDPKVKPISDYVQAHKPAVLRALAAYDKAISMLRANEALNADRAKRIMELEALDAENKNIIELLTFALDEKFPEDVGGSMGGIVG